MRTREQLRHEVINLKKTLKLLQSSADDEDWHQNTPSSRNAKWLKAQAVLGGISHCRAVLSNLKSEDLSVLGNDLAISTDSFQDDVTQTLDRLERIAAVADEALKPRPRRPPSLLSKLPKPATKPSTARLDTDDATEVAREGSANKPSQSQLGVSPSDLLLDPIKPETSNAIVTSSPGHTLLPPSQSSSELTRKTAVPNFLQTSTALQEDLADQLAQMATQLKRNAAHFAESLEKDKAALSGTQEAMDQNYDNLTKERIRLRDHRGKSGNTTCLVIMSILVVIVSFIVMLLIIRIT